MSLLGDRIRDAAQGQGLMISALTEKAGLSRQHLNKILSGKTGKSKHLPAIASALGVDVGWLATGKHSVVGTQSQPIPADTAEAILAELRKQNERWDRIEALLTSLASGHPAAVGVEPRQVAG